MAPPCILGESYVVVSATNNETIALRGDGVAVAVGLDDYGSGPLTLCGIHVEDLESFGCWAGECSFKLLDLAGRGLWNKVSASPCEEGGGGRRKEE